MSGKLWTKNEINLLTKYYGKIGSSYNKLRLLLPRRSKIAINMKAFLLK